LPGADSPAERITQLTVELGQVRHEAGTLRSDSHNVTARCDEGAAAACELRALDDREAGLQAKAQRIELEGERTKQLAPEAKVASTEARQEELSDCCGAVRVAP
jgi:hypothetical protein